MGPALDTRSLPGSIPLHRGAVDLARLVTSTLVPLEREASAHDVTLSIDCPEGGVCLSADPEKMAWTIATLVGNALRYVRHGTLRLPGGTIVVRIRRNPADNTVLIDVEDDGPGIPRERLASLLERRPGEEHAQGLALRLVQDIVAAHGGALNIESSTDPELHGTIVHLTLPSS